MNIYKQRDWKSNPLPPALTHEDSFVSGLGWWVWAWDRSNEHGFRAKYFVSGSGWYI